MTIIRYKKYKKLSFNEFPALHVEAIALSKLLESRRRILLLLNINIVISTFFDFRFARSVWRLTPRRSPRSRHSSPRLRSCSTSSPGMTRPTWTPCSSASRPSSRTDSSGEHVRIFISCQLLFKLYACTSCNSSWNLLNVITENVLIQFIL